MHTRTAYLRSSETVVGDEWSIPSLHQVEDCIKPWRDTSSDRQIPNLFIAGLSYRQTKIDLREKFSIAQSDYPRILSAFLNRVGADEVVVISTCNRIEFVAAHHGSLGVGKREGVKAVFRDIGGEEIYAFDEGMYFLENDQAVNHLFRVASGLDSMVVGEPQIFGQIKNSYKLSKEHGYTSTYLNRLFHMTFAAAKHVRTATGICRDAVSTCYAAREIASSIYGNLRNVSVLLIGAGNTGELALKHFVGAGVEDVTICNRTFSRARTLAERYGGKAVAFGDITHCLSEADLVIGAVQCDSVNRLAIDVSDVDMAIRRRWKPQLYIDLGVPRNFDTTISTISGVRLYNIDDLQKVVNVNISKRAAQVEMAESLLRGETRKFYDWLSIRSVEPTIVALKEHCMTSCKSEVEKTMRRLRLSNLSSDDMELVKEALIAHSQALVSKVVHPVIESIKVKAKNPPLRS